VEDPAPVAVVQAPEQLEEEELRVPRVQAARVLVQVLRKVRVLKREIRGRCYEFLKYLHRPKMTKIWRFL
jgi:hypothetical protein